MHLGDVMTCVGGYNQCTGGCSLYWDLLSVHRGISSVH